MKADPLNEIIFHQAPIYLTLATSSTFLKLFVTVRVNENHYPPPPPKNSNMDDTEWIWKKNNARPKKMGTDMMSRAGWERKFVAHLPVQALINLSHFSQEVDISFVCVCVYIYIYDSAWKIMHPTSKCCVIMSVECARPVSQPS